MYSVEALMIWYMMYHIISASTDVSCIMKSLRGSEYFTLVLSFKDNMTRINNNRTHMKSVSSFSVSFSNCFACLRSYKKMIIQSMTTSAHTPRNGHKAAYLSAATQKYTHTHTVFQILIQYEIIQTVYVTDKWQTPILLVRVQKSGYILKKPSRLGKPI